MQTLYSSPETLFYAFLKVKVLYLPGESLCRWRDGNRALYAAISGESFGKHYPN